MMEMEHEELSKKSYEVVVHLDEKAMKVSQDSEESDDDDETGRPICNSWKGQNYALPILGKFETDFIKEVKKYQVPKSVPLSMDTFCRMEANYPAGDPPLDDAFLLWERPGFEDMLTTKHDDVMTPHDDPLSFEINSDSQDDDQSQSDSEEEDYGDSCSETELEIFDYVKSKLVRKSQGLNVTDEKLIYDEEYDVIRNLHSTSISLTRYGDLPEDKGFGKAELLFDQLSPEEQRMLKALEDGNSKESPPYLEKTSMKMVMPGSSGDFTMSK